MATAFSIVNNVLSVNLDMDVPQSSKSWFFIIGNNKKKNSTAVNDFCFWLNLKWPHTKWARYWILQFIVHFLTNRPPIRIENMTKFPAGMDSSLWVWLRWLSLVVTWWFVLHTYMTIARKERSPANMFLHLFHFAYLCI